MTQVHSFLFRTAAAIAFALINIFALYLLLRGHNMPGGGFIGGLAATMAILLYGLAIGFDAIERQLPADPVRMAGFGVLIAIGTSLLPVLFGYPYFGHIQGYVDLPFFGQTYLGTPLLFDIGVLLTVIGISTKIIFLIARSTSKRPSLMESEFARYAAVTETHIEDQDAPRHEAAQLEDDDAD